MGSSISKIPIRLLFIFEILSLSLIFMYRWDNLDFNTFATGIGLILLVYFSNSVLRRISSGDHYLFLIVSMMFSIGLIMIFRISSDLGVKQLLWLLIGIGVFFLSYFTIKKIDVWDKMITLYLGVAYGLFAMTFILGSRLRGAINWVNIGGVSFQPAEITKIALIFFLAAYYFNLEKYSKNKYSEWIVMGIVYSYIGLLFLQRDLGTALIFFGIYTGLQYIYCSGRRYELANLSLAVLGGTLGYVLFDHVKVRVTTWINPWPYINDKGYQITQSLFAIAEGSYFGTGLGRGNPAFIPLSYNDFIFSSISEEMGVFTGIGIIMLFVLLVYRGFKIALLQNHKFYRIVALGISLMFGLQAFIIIGGAIKVIPLTGLTLPFISYGGSSIVSSFLALGILQGASEKVVKEDEYNE